MPNKVLRVSLLSFVALPALMLSACGDLVPEPYHGVPYTSERTAGTGVAYVRARMMPAKETRTEMIAPAAMVETKVEPVVEAPPPPPVAAPVTQGDKLFERRQSK